MTLFLECGPISNIINIIIQFFLYMQAEILLLTRSGVPQWL